MRARLLFDYLPHLFVLALLDWIIILVFIPWVLLSEKDGTTAVAWCLAVFFMPLVGAALFWVFGYNYMHRQIRRKRRHRILFRCDSPERACGDSDSAAGPAADDLGWLAQQ